MHSDVESVGTSPTTKNGAEQSVDISSVDSTLGNATADHVIIDFPAVFRSDVSL